MDSPHITRDHGTGLPSMQVSNGVQKFLNGVHMGCNSIPNGLQPWGTQFSFLEQAIDTKNQFQKVSEARKDYFELSSCEVNQHSVSNIYF
jgi:hypothetical protein